MTVLDLKKMIESLPDGMQVILQKDAEGNGYSPLSGCDLNCIYIPSSPWHGEVYDTQWTADDAMMPAQAWESMKNEQAKCLILYPIN